MPENHPAAASPCIKLSDAIRLVAPSAELVRVYPLGRGLVHFFSSDFQRVQIELDSAKAVACLVREYFSLQTDWHHSHDFHLPTGALYLTPDPQQRGYVPEDDLTFGMTPVRRIAISGRSGDE